MEFKGPIYFQLDIPNLHITGIGPVETPYLLGSTATGKVSMHVDNTPQGTRFLPIKLSEHIYAFYCLDQTSVNPQYLYLTGNVEDGSVSLRSDVGLAYSGAHWLVEFALCSGDNARLICLGISGPGPQTRKQLALCGSAFAGEPKLCPVDSEKILDLWKLAPSSFP